MYKSPKHDQIVAVNVMITIIRAKCCTIDPAAQNCIIHDKPRVLEIKKNDIGTPSTMQGIQPKWKTLGGVQIHFKDFILNHDMCE